jgi:D-proline reductase (dithiol) PrdB
MTCFAFYPRDVRERLEREAAEYVFVQDEPTPWTPLRRELGLCRALLVTTSGLRLKQAAPFGADRTWGSAEVREVSTYVRTGDIEFDFHGFDPAPAHSDLNVVAPVDRLKELVDRGVLGGVGEAFLSFFGRCGRLDDMKAAADAAARRMREAHEADVAVVVPASFECNQTAAIVSRALEAAGIATVTLSTVREITEQVRAPRSLFINFPFGRTLGPPHAIALQRSIMQDIVGALRTMDRAGKVRSLPYVWEGTAA